MPMKVTVCFDRVKVLVPCGDGEILVRELIEKAITRYKKAIGKSTDFWVSVHTLRTVSEDSILDPDDLLLDVIDDREQLIADFEEQGGSRITANGDGQSQSASSAGTASPDIFQAELTNIKHHHRGYSIDGGNDVIVTATDINSGSGLTVRRGSEPNLTLLNGEKNSGLVNGTSDVDPVEPVDGSHKDSNSNKDAEHVPIIKGLPPRNEKEKTPPFSRFARDSWRQSLGNQPNMYKWLEAQERQEDKFKQVERQGPVGGATSPKQEGETTSDKPQKPPLPPHVRPKEVGILLCLKNDGTPLGIHVVPDFNEDGRETGLLVQGIEQGGRIFQDGRLKVEDRIIEINGQDLHSVTFPKAQEIFRNAMKTDVVTLKIVKHSVPALPKKPPPAVLPKPRGHSPVKPSPLTLPPQTLDINSPQSSPDQTSTPMELSVTSSLNSKDSPEDQSNSTSSSVRTNKPITTSSPIKPLSPIKRAPPAPPTRHPSTTLSSTPTGSNESKEADDASKSSTGTLTKNREAIIAPTNTKKIGKKVDLELVKGPLGLGFSITTRDNSTGGPSPIYIKNILPKGAAVTDGRLKAGDRLLEVNGVEMTGKSQGDAVSVLRNTSLGSTVNIVVSRQEVEELDDRFKVPRELPSEKSGDDGTLAVMKNKELIEFDIPLNDSGSAGLGVSVKGKTLTTEDGTRDLGIFVKAVIHGGAASKDGRLLVNDQLLEVNSSSLINRSNTDAMNLLRNAMQEEGPLPGCINIKVARRIGAPSPSPFSSPGSQEMDFPESINQSNNKEENNNISLDKTDCTANVSDEETPVKTKNGGIPNMNDFKSPNLFLDRIMAGNGLRNMSYTRATHDSYAESPEPKRSQGNLIDLSKQKPRPHSTLGLERESPTGSNSSSSEDLNKEPAWLKGPDWTRHASQTSEESELSPTGDGFARDAFGRQSMSEKRKGHGDPRSSEIYQKVKGLKDLHKGLQKNIQQSGSYGRLVRAGSAESLLSRSNSNIHSPLRGPHDKYSLSNIRGPGPPSNLKRFSSLENLTTMHDTDMSGSFEEDETSPQPRMARKRGGNESFRCAVDRSYDPVPHLDMDPQKDDENTELSRRMRRSQSVEEESSEGGSIGRDPSNSARSSVSDTVFNDDPFGKKKGGKKVKEARRSGGLLKGFFKFGRGRKTPVEDIGKADNLRSEDGNKDIDGLETGNHRDHREYQEQMWRQAQADQERAQEQYRRLQEQQHLEQQKQRQQQMNQQSYNPFPVKAPTPHGMGHSAPVISNRDTNRDEPLTRAEKIQQLRADHQRRHQERQGHYPQEDKEEEYERQIQEEEKKRYGQSAIPSNIDGQGQRSRPSSRNQMERPSSRTGAGDFGSQGTGNYQDYSEMPPPGNRHVSDSNITKYNYHRPPSRGALTSDHGNYFHPSQYSAHPSQQQVSGIQRGPTPTYERQFQKGSNPAHEHDKNMNYPSKIINTGYSNNSNYHPAHRGPTPTNINANEKWYYSEDSDMRRGVNNVNQSKNNDNVTRQEVMPPGGGSYGNPTLAYRDPVYTAMAGKRPVKSLSSQPNSAKV